MVLTLVNLSLLAIRDGMERGKIRQVHELPRRWHQAILDFVLKHGTILQPACLDALTAIEFVQQFTFLQTLNGRVNDHTFLDRVSESVHKIFQHKNVDYRFLHQLALNLYAIPISDRDTEKHKISIENFKNAVGLIGKCSNLQTLHFRFLVAAGIGDAIETNPTGPIVRFLPVSSATSSSSWKPLEDGGFLNKIAAYRPCLSILENLLDFSLMTVDANGRRLPPLITSHQPLINFRCLRSLQLIGGTAYFDAWFHFLQSVSNTLEALHVENVEFHWGRERNACVLPFRMPKLESLQAHGVLSYCDALFVKNIQKCENLEFVSLTLSGLESDENLLALAEMEAVRDIRLNFRHGLFAERGADEIVGKMVQLFSEQISSFVFNGARTQPLTLACELLIGWCDNLATLRLDTSPWVVESDQTYLAPLFNNRQRAWILRDLELHGRLAHHVLSALFENCVNLESFTIWDCPQLSDMYLYQWASRGARPHTLKIVNCPKITDAGLTSILKSCGFGLTHFRFTCVEGSRVGEGTMRVLAECCRNVEWFCCSKTACDEKTLAKIRAKSFKYPVRAVLV